MPDEPTGWSMHTFTLVVADALAECVASHLRAVEDSVSNIASTRERMADAHSAYFLLEQARKTGAGQRAQCLPESHAWGQRVAVPQVRVNGVNRPPEVYQFRCCESCGSVELRIVDKLRAPAQNTLIIPNV